MDAFGKLAYLYHASRDFATVSVNAETKKGAMWLPEYGLFITAYSEMPKSRIAFW